MTARQMHQLREPAGAVDEGGDDGSAAASDNQVSLAVADAGAGFDDGRPRVDELSGRNKLRWH
jgi:hypothetical protein